MTVVLQPWQDLRDPTHAACAAEIARLQATITELTLENGLLRAQLQALTEQVETLTDQITKATAARYKATTPSPAGAKPPRKKRDVNTTRCNRTPGIP